MARRGADGGSVRAAADRVWVRRCRSCGGHDRGAAVGQPSLLDGPWSCRSCRGREFDAIRVALPDS